MPLLTNGNRKVYMTAMSMRFDNGVGWLQMNLISALSLFQDQRIWVHTCLVDLNLGKG